MTREASIEAKAARRRRDTITALARPMPLCPFVGDPRVVDQTGKNSSHPTDRLLCLYAANLMQRRGLLPWNAASIDARYVSPGVVVFTRADASQAVIGQFVFPAVLELDEVEA